MDWHDQQIIKFVAKNPGCNKEDVVNGTLDLSRVPTINRLNNLISLGTIRTDAKGERFRNRLYLVDDDLISSVSKELRRFEVLFFKLLNKVIRLTGKPDPKIWNAYKKKFGRLPTQNDLQELLFHALVIFQMMISKYVLKSVFEWPQIKTDKEYLSNLNGLLFHEITDLYTKLLHLMTVNNVQGLEELMEKALKRFYPQNFLDYFANPFEDFGLFEDLKKVGSTGLIDYELEDVELEDGLKKMMASA